MVRAAKRFDRRLFLSLSIFNCGPSDTQACWASRSSICSSSLLLLLLLLRLFLQMDLGACGARPCRPLFPAGGCTCRVPWAQEKQ